MATANTAEKYKDKEVEQDNSYREELIPPEGDDKVGEKVFEIVKKMIEDKRTTGVYDRTMRNHELYRNQHWRRKPLKKVPLATANYIYRHLNRTVNTLTDNNPIFNFARDVDLIKREDQELFEDMQHTSEHWWNETEQQDDFHESVLNGELYGIAIEKSLFNGEAEGRMGEVETIVIDPLNFGWWPLKLKDPKKLQTRQAIAYYRPMSVSEIKQTWGDAAKDVVADKELLEDLGEERREAGAKNVDGKSGGFFTSISNAVSAVINAFSSLNDEENDEALVAEMWVKDYSTGEDGKPKYTGHIRRIIVTNGGKVVLEDEDNPNINKALPREEQEKTYLFDRFPFYARNSVKDTSNAWGLSDVEQIEQLNIEVNKALSQFVLEKDRKTRPKLINPKTSGVKNTDLTNYIGIINPSTATEGEGIHWLEPPSSNIDFMQAIELFRSMLMDIAGGSFDLDKAKEPGKNVIAYKAIAALLENAAIMMRGKIRSYSGLIRERGRMYMSHVHNFYTEDRYITYNDKDGELVSKKVNGKKLNHPAKLTVVVGSTMPVSKVQQREEAIELWRQRAVDQEWLLEKMEVSGRSEIIRRMKAGVFGILFGKLQALGCPQPLIAYMDKIAKMDDKEFERGIEQKKLPPFMGVLQQAIQAFRGRGQEQQPQLSPTDEAEIGLKIEQAKKLQADTMLVVEKIATERVDQMVRFMGVKFDEETLKNERAKITAEIMGKVNMENGEPKSPEARDKDGGPYQERGLKSNNREVA